MSSRGVTTSRDRPFISILIPQNLFIDPDEGKNITKKINWKII